MSESNKEERAKTLAGVGKILDCFAFQMSGIADCVRQIDPSLTHEENHEAFMAELFKAQFIISYMNEKVDTAIFLNFQNGVPDQVARRMNDLVVDDANRRVAAIEDLAKEVFQ